MPTKAAPALFTPDNLVPVIPKDFELARPTRPDDELWLMYDIDRTIDDLKTGKYKRIALQFPDSMLPDAPRVFQLLSRGLGIQSFKNITSTAPFKEPEDVTCCGKQVCTSNVDKVVDEMAEKLQVSGIDTPPPPKPVDDDEEPQLFILGDTSYGECCVDEIAAEHVHADVVVHYGRACLSPTQRLPVIYVFTHSELDIEPVIAAFKDTYPEKDAKVIIAADVLYQDHVASVTKRLQEKEGYTNLFATEVLHDPSSPIPNRTLPESGRNDPEALKEWALFHISNPPNALLLTLSSRVSAIHIFPTSFAPCKPIEASTAAALRRRYATLTKLSTVPIFGILVNTLSVKNYLHIVEHVKAQIAAAGKKSYLFVMGKLNTAKLANFSEIGGWVVVACWESSLIDSKDFWRPVITPYELELALKGDQERLWTGSWRSDYQSLLDAAKAAGELPEGAEAEANRAEANAGIGEDEEESAPPEFDLRTGQYVSTVQTRPMQQSVVGDLPVTDVSGSRSLAKRVGGDIATIKGVVSPGAEYLRTQRTWRGLGSDFEVRYEEDGEEGEGSSEPTTAVREGRSGIARGYTVGDNKERR
ncbi:diphthamide biosynthesis protein [Ascosphaera apis ARSEF 7405]|uniref:2-(3-amino-3-carboxypropyl)histidine synthase subunit 2 n=1 Tax=Ascosphaera apis ARSEF 7405 TaxID=392613 RepID=A0A167ZKJ9_9EURO|nr:diphthamide biosynthesis protein [Ascosphaera apis ARSEF 7405]